MIFRAKATELESDNGIHEVLAALSKANDSVDGSKLLEETPIMVSRVATPTITPCEKINSESGAHTETKQLIVSRGISLSGKISFCDRLIIEGNVEVELENCHTVEVTESGTFKGAADIAGAEISGQYEGSLTVRDNLLVHATGRVNGTVRYGRLHIEAGGEINGDVKSLGTASPKHTAQAEQRLKADLQQSERSHVTQVT